MTRRRRSASLWLVWRSSDGRVLARVKAGRDAHELLEHLGMTLSDLVLRVGGWDAYAQGGWRVGAPFGTWLEGQVAKGGPTIVR